MKTLIPVLFFIILIGSCKKDPCYTCDTKTFAKYTDVLLSTKSEVVCTDSEIEILGYQTDRYDFSSSTSYTTCECVKK